MARYLSEEAAAADDIHIEHEPDRHRFAVYQGLGDERDGVGEAHYTLLGNTGINFDHTILDPKLRGTGLAGLLAHHALTSDIVEGRNIVASCWFIAGYLRKHPELTRDHASSDSTEDLQGD